MSDLTHDGIRFESAHGIRLRLRRYITDPKALGKRRKPVLLLHGASANSGTFTVGKVDGGLAGWLAERDFDPWLLDWRGSGIVVDESADLLESVPRAFNFNDAAVYDVPRALQEIRTRTSDLHSNIAVVGHCMGGGILAEAIALGKLRGLGVDRVVLLTLGLFYRTPIDGRLKSEERILERLRGTKLKNGQAFTTVDPRPRLTQPGALQLRTPWPDKLEDTYRAWPNRLKSHIAQAPSDPNTRRTSPAAGTLLETHELCNRLAFMYGMPYHHPNLVTTVHGDDEKEGCLAEQFGAIPLHMYIHAASNVRQGHATWYSDTPQERDLLSEDARREFTTFEKVTFITGELNRLWHRDSIDLMYEWVCRGATDERIEKYVVDGFGHQDLLWGQEAGQIYEKIAVGVGGRSTEPASRFQASELRTTA